MAENGEATEKGLKVHLLMMLYFSGANTRQNYLYLVFQFIEALKKHLLRICIFERHAKPKFKSH